MAREPRAPQKHQPQQGGGGQPPASQVAWHARPQLPHETRPSQALQASLEEGPGADCSSSVSSQGAQQTRGAARLARGRLTCARPARVSEMAREPKSTLAPRRASPRRGGGKEGLARPGTHASDDLPHAPSLGPLAAAPCRAFWLPRHHAKRMTNSSGSPLAGEGAQRTSLAGTRTPLELRAHMGHTGHVGHAEAAQRVGLRR